MSVFDPASVEVDPYADFDGGDVETVSLAAPKRRSTARIIGGVGAVALAALLGAYAFAAASPETTRVMVAGGDLAVGQPITAADLRTVEVGSAAGLDAVSPDEQDTLIGLTPRTPVPAGTVLNAGFFVTVEEAIPVGKVIVGAVLEPGSAPTSTLRDGDPVGLISVVQNAGPDTAPTLIGAGEVWAIGPASDNSDDVWVSVLVDEGMQTDVAQAASSGQLWVSAVRS